MSGEQNILAFSLSKVFNASLGGLFRREGRYVSIDNREVRQDAAPRFLELFFYFRICVV